MPDDVDLVAPQSAFSRRDFVATSVVAGFALAVQPVQAQTMITTSAEGLDAGDVMIKVRDGEIPGYRAVPKDGGRVPTVLVIQEIFGVHEHIKDVCRRLARFGCFAVAPSLYHRQGDVTKATSIDEVRPIVAKVPDAQVMADLDDTVAWAKAGGRADTDRLAITGFCWGGRIVWLYAAHNPGLDAGIAWYGRLVGQDTPNTPKHPLDVVQQIRAPVLGLYGGADAGIPVETVERMRAALKAAGNERSEIVVYADAPHAFHADYRPSYREGPAKDGWRRLTEWLKRHGVA